MKSNENTGGNMDRDELARRMAARYDRIAADAEQARLVGNSAVNNSALRELMVLRRRAAKLGIDLDY